MGKKSRGVELLTSWTKRVVAIWTTNLLAWWTKGAVCVIDKKTPKTNTKQKQDVCIMHEKGVRIMDKTGLENNVGCWRPHRTKINSEKRKRKSETRSP